MLAQRKHNWDVQEKNDIKVSSSAKSVVRTINGQLRTKCFAVVCLLACMAIVTAIQSEYIVRSGYNLVKIKDQMAKVEKENEQIRLEIAKLRSPQRIQDIAVNQLGMVRPQSVYCSVSTLPKEASEKSVPTSNARNMLNPFGQAEASKGRQ